MKKNRLIFVVVILIISNFSHPVFANEEGDSLWPVPDYKGDIWERPALSGDWLGFRTDMANKGITFSVDNILTFQTILDGGKTEEEEEFGGSVDYELHLDLNKMGLWEGAFLRVFAETQYGGFVNDHTGAALAANNDGLFPLGDEDETTLTSVVFYQFLSEWFGLYLGKIDTLESDVNEFAHGMGKTQFLNQNFVFNPVSLRTTPTAALGAGFLLVHPDKESIFNFTVLDPNGEPDESGFDEVLFDDGVLLSGELRLAVERFGLPGHEVFGGTWTNKEYFLLEQNFRLLLLQLVLSRDPTLEKKEGSWCFYYNFDQYLYTEKDDPEQGIGIFGRFGAADEETSPVGQFYSIGFGGKGVIPARDKDTFGIGYFYVKLSADLPNPFDILDDAKGGEFFYNVEVTPWLHITADYQVIDPSLEARDVAHVVGVRLKTDF
jgi:porin